MDELYLSARAYDCTFQGRRSHNCRSRRERGYSASAGPGASTARSNALPEIGPVREEEVGGGSGSDSTTHRRRLKAYPSAPALKVDRHAHTNDKGVVQILSGARVNDELCIGLDI